MVATSKQRPKSRIKTKKNDAKLCQFCANLSKKLSISVSRFLSTMRHYFYLDTRMERKSGTYPLKLVVSINGKRIYLHTGICLEEECWDSYDERVTGGLKEERQLNMRIDRIRLEVADFLATNVPTNVSIPELRRIFGCIVEGRDWREKEGDRKSVV